MFVKKSDSSRYDKFMANEEEGGKGGLEQPKKSICRRGYQGYEEG